MRYVIIGNSVAAVNACQGIRELDKKGPITIVSAENYYAYGRPLISYWLEGKTAEDRMTYLPPDFYSQNNIQVLLGRKALHLDWEKREVELDDGARLPYDRLLIATGGQAVVPPLEGLKEGDYFTFLTYEDVLKLAELASPGREAVILGAGPSGLKAMESLVCRGVKVTLVELAERIWSPVLDKRSASMVTEFITQRGVQVILQDTIRGGERQKDGRLRLVLQSGKTLEADILVIAIGVRPNVDLLRNIPGVTIRRGVVVDEYLNVGLPGVFAAGDVVEGNPPLLPHAASQGRVAGRNMAGASEKYKASVPYNALGFWGLHIISIGTTNCEPQEGMEVLVCEEREKRIFRKIVLKEGRLVGALFINSLDRAGLYRWLTEERINVLPFKERLLDEDFGFLDLPPDLWESRLRK